MIDLGPYIAVRCEKQAAQFMTAFSHIPADKHLWQPSETSRSALNQFAEIAILSGYCAQVLSNKSWEGLDMHAYFPARAELEAAGVDAVRAKFDENIPLLTGALKALTDEDLALNLDTPFGKMTLEDTAHYAVWNMAYHEGQLCYIASILGCLP